jgi:predicted acyltransferase
MASVAPVTGAVTRLVSLDVFRGLTMAAMVVVNNPGDWNHVYAPLLHAPWHGWTPTDLIFPFFLFIVGVSLTFARTSGAGWRAILRRAAVLFALGLFLNGFPYFPLDTWRVPGVLQRIALCYLAAAAVWQAASPVPRTRVWQLGGLAAGLMLGYWALLALVPPPGGTAGDLSPDGNLAAWLDRQLLAGHLWRPTWDPEGLLSTIPAIATTLLGVLTGMYMGAGSSRPMSPAAAFSRPPGKTLLLVVAGLAALLAGLAWDVVFPINKPLWTSSYTLFSAGAAALTLAACYWLIDARRAPGTRASAWTLPFVVLGTNAIALFVISSLVGRLTVTLQIAGEAGEAMALKTWLYQSLYVPLAPPKVSSLLYALTHLVVLFGILAVMYRRRIFLRV